MDLRINETLAPLVPVGAVSNRTIGVNLVDFSRYFSNYGYKHAALTGLESSLLPLSINIPSLRD